MAYKHLEDKSEEHQKAVAIGVEILDIAFDIVVEGGSKIGNRSDAIRLATEAYRIVRESPDGST